MIAATEYVAACAVRMVGADSRQMDEDSDAVAKAWADAWIALHDAVAALDPETVARLLTISDPSETGHPQA